MEREGVVRVGGDTGRTPEESYALLPEHMRGGMRGYLEQHRAPGAFLRSVLENDLAGAARRADAVNAPLLGSYVAWLDAEAPGNAWGSVRAVAEWLAAEPDDER